MLESETTPRKWAIFEFFRVYKKARMPQKLLFRLLQRMIPSHQGGDEKAKGDLKLFNRNRRASTDVISARRRAEIAARHCYQSRRGGPRHYGSAFANGRTVREYKLLWNFWNTIEMAVNGCRGFPRRGRDRWEHFVRYQNHWLGRMGGRRRKPRLLY